MTSLFQRLGWLLVSNAVALLIGCAGTARPKALDVIYGDYEQNRIQHYKAEIAGLDKSATALDAVSSAERQTENDKLRLIAREQLPRRGRLACFRANGKPLARFDEPRQSKANERQVMNNEHARFGGMLERARSRDGSVC
jgi:hypothetical protein